jgi:hypothetical protein
VDREGFPNTAPGFMEARLQSCQTKDQSLREAFSQVVADRLKA